MADPSSNTLGAHPAPSCKSHGLFSEGTASEADGWQSFPETHSERQEYFLIGDKNELDTYVENAWLKQEKTSPQEIADQLGIVSRCMKDASVEGISEDLRFYTTFNALLALHQPPPSRPRFPASINWNSDRSNSSTFASEIDDHPSSFPKLNVFDHQECELSQAQSAPIRRAMIT
jgi:hypothetical protein